MTWLSPKVPTSKHNSSGTRFRRESWRDTNIQPIKAVFYWLSPLWYDVPSSEPCGTLVSRPLRTFTCSCSLHPTGSKLLWALTVQSHLCSPVTQDSQPLAHRRCSVAFVKIVNLCHFLAMTSVVQSICLILKESIRIQIPFYGPNMVIIQ